MGSSGSVDFVTLGCNPHISPVLGVMARAMGTPQKKKKKKKQKKKKKKVSKVQRTPPKEKDGNRMMHKAAL